VVIIIPHDKKVNIILASVAYRVKRIKVGTRLALLQFGKDAGTLAQREMTLGMGYERCKLDGMSR